MAAGRRAALGALVMLLALGCAVPSRRSAPEAFRFPDDAFAFANETVWEYRLDAATRRMTWSRREPTPPFSLRCGNMVRAARQFRVHARFDPSAPPLGPDAYRELVREVVGRDPRQQDGDGDPVVIPGYPDLRTFSAAQTAIVQEALEGPWQSYVQRGNWRMIFPFTPRHQRRLAERLRAEVAEGRLPIVHVLVYPQQTLNHMVLVYGAEETPAEVRFHAYDPNDAGAPILLTYDRGARTFVYPQVPYFGGGPVKAYAIYESVLY
jgi:hypothetical protein